MIQRRETAIAVEEDVAPVVLESDDGAKYVSCCSPRESLAYRTSLQSASELERARFFYAGGSNKDGYPVFYLIMNR